MANLSLPILDQPKTTLEKPKVNLSLPTIEKEDVSFGEEIYRTVVGAARDVIQGSYEAGKFLRENVPGSDILLGKPQTDIVEDLAKEKGLQLKLPEVKEPTYFGGQFVRDVIGFASPYMATGRVTQAPKAAGLVGKAISFAKETALKAPLIEQISFSPYEERLSNLAVEGLSSEFAKKYGLDTLKPIAEYLKADPTDTDSEARFKMAIEGIATGGFLEGGIKAVKSVVNTAKYLKNKISGVKPDTVESKIKQAEKSPWGESPSSEKQKLNEFAKVKNEYAEPLEDVLERKLKYESTQPVESFYQKKATKILDYIKPRIGLTKISELGYLPKQDEYLKLRYGNLGKLFRLKEIGDKYFDIFSKASKDDNINILNFLKTKDVKPIYIKNENLRGPAVRLKEDIINIGKSLVKRGIIPESVFKQNEGSYLVTAYLKYLNKQTPYSYTKKKKQLTDLEKEFLGEIKEVSILGPKSILRPGEDIIFYDFFDEIMKNSEWAYKPSVTNYNGQKVSSVWLREEAQRLEDEIAKNIRGKESEKLINELKDLARGIEKNIDEKDLTNFRKVPNTKKYGKLRGAYVRKEIYDDLLKSEEIIRNPNWAQKILGDQGLVSKGTKLWKFSKVAMNPPSVARNFVSNMILLHMSGVPLVKIPILFGKAIKEMINNGPHYKIAKDYGITQTSFNKQEMIEINRKFLKLKAEDGTWIDKLKNIAFIYPDVAGKAYQYAEEVGKLMKIIDEMSKGADAADAALAAQKTLFDYSLVPSTLRSIRNITLGIPFATFYYKVLPSLLETAIRRPYKFAPYIAIPYAAHAMIADKYDVSMEDLEKLNQTIPQYIKDRGSVFIWPVKDEYGNWQIFDYSYFLPWSMFTGLVRDAKDLNLQKFLQGSGAFGSPAIQLATAWTTNIDPFTQRPISDETDPGWKQLADKLLYTAKMAMPTWLTDIGFAGRLLQAIRGDVDRYGDPRITKTQALLRGVGVNMYPVDPEKSRDYNIYQFQKKKRDIIKNRSIELRDPNITKKQMDKIIKSSEEQLNKLDEELRDYMEKSKIPPQLRKKK